MEDSTGANTIDDDVPGEDCVLVIGPDQIRMRFNSHFLSAASAPLRAMLSPRWREGTNLRNGSLLPEIVLPEDDIATWQILHAVLHHQNDNIPEKLPVHLIISVAVTADMYDMTRALMFASKSWLDSDCSETSNLLVLAAAAYLLESKAAFRKITKKIILNHSGPFTAISCAQVDAVMDGKMIGLLEEARSIARLELANIFLNGIDDPSAACPHKCGWSGRYAYAYMKQLKTHDLWPAELGRQTIAEAIVKAGAISDPVPEERSPSCQYDYKHSVPEYRRYRQYSLEILNSRTGLCFDCIKSKSGSATSCQLEH